MNTIAPPAQQIRQEINDEHPDSGLEQLYTRSQSVVSRRVAGETLIVPVRGKVGDLASIYSFNATGTLLWDSLASPQSLAGLVDAVLHEYVVERDQAEQDVKQFLNDTVNVGLVEIREQISMAGFASAGFVSGRDFSRAVKDAI